MEKRFFTNEMATAIEEGRKDMTTRDHKWPLGEYEACRGSWRKKDSIKPFGVITVISNSEVSWPFPLDNWKREGFDSREKMLAFMEAHDFGYDKAPQIFCHIFTFKESSA